MIRSKLIIVISLMILVSISSVLGVSYIGRVIQEGPSSESGACDDTDNGYYSTVPGVVINKPAKGADRIIGIDKCLIKNGRLGIEENNCEGRRALKDFKTAEHLGAGRCVPEAVTVTIKNKNNVDVRQTVQAAKWVSDTCTSNVDGSAVYQGQDKVPECRGNSRVTYACNSDTTLRAVTTPCGSGQVCKDEDDGYDSAQCVSATELRVQGEGQQSVPALATRLNRLICKLGEEDDSYLDLLTPGFDCATV